MTRLWSQQTYIVIDYIDLQRKISEITGEDCRLYSDDWYNGSYHFFHISRELLDSDRDWIDYSDNLLDMFKPVMTYKHIHKETGLTDVEYYTQNPGVRASQLLPDAFEIVETPSDAYKSDNILGILYWLMDNDDLPEGDIILEVSW